MKGRGATALRDLVIQVLVIVCVCVCVCRYA
jgi:hypothetical protein